MEILRPKLVSQSTVMRLAPFSCKVEAKALAAKRAY